MTLRNEGVVESRGDPRIRLLYLPSVSGATFLF